MIRASSFRLEGGLEAEGRAGRQDHGAFEDMLKLAHVSGPRVALQKTRMGVAQREPGAPELRRMDAEELLGERKDVLLSFPKGRHFDREDAEPVVEILAEGSRGRFDFEVTIRGGHDTDIHLARPIIADALEFAFLKNPKQLCLQDERNLTDLVEKQGSPVGELESAGAIPVRPCERTSHMSEELALEKLLRNRRAVHLDERSVGTPAPSMNRTGDQLLADAGLAPDEHGGGRARHALDEGQDVLQRVAAPDEFTELIFLSNLFAEIVAFALDLGLETGDLVEGLLPNLLGPLSVGDVPNEDGVNE
jgi:hypothetical protein